MAIEKQRVQAVTDPEVIESIKRNQYGDVIGGYNRGVYWAYTESLEQWRARKAGEVVDSHE